MLKKKAQVALNFLLVGCFFILIDYGKIAAKPKQVKERQKLSNFLPNQAKFILQKNNHKLISLNFIVHNTPEFVLAYDEKNQSCGYTGLPSSVYLLLLADGYSNHIITFTFFKKIRQFNQSSQHGPKKCRVYLHLLRLETVSTIFEKQITTAIQRCYLAVETRVVVTTRPLFSATKKNVPVSPAHHHNNIFYQFVCHCDSRYVGRTFQMLQERIK